MYSRPLNSIDISSYISSYISSKEAISSTSSSILAPFDNNNSTVDVWPDRIAIFSSDSLSLYNLLMLLSNISSHDFNNFILLFLQ